MWGGAAKEEIEGPLVLEETSESLLLLDLIKSGGCLLPETKVQLREKEWDPVQTGLGFAKASYQVVVNIGQQSCSPQQGREAAYF